MLKKILHKMILEKKNIILYLFFLLIMVLVLANKKNVHEDEIWSYMLANCLTQYMEPVDGQTYLPADSIWIDNMSVHDDTIFDYATVWKNQAKDVHPPLYYAILHAVCSLIPNRFSIWCSMSINIFFALLTFGVVGRLLYKLTGNEDMSMLGKIFFALSAGTLSAVSFLRMYVMVMFEITYITYLFIRAITEKRTWKFYISLVAASVIGALTHYYFIIYLFFICLLFGIYLLLEKRWKETGIFIISMMFSAGISVAIFPPMIQQMFVIQSAQRQETLKNLQIASFSEYGNRMKTTYAYIDNQLFGGCLIYILVALLLFSGYYVLGNKKISEGGKPFFKQSHIQWLFMILPCVGYFFVVSKIAVWAEDRYFFPLYPIIVILVIVFLHFYCEKLMGEKVYIVLFGLLAIMLVNSWRGGIKYLYLDSQALLDKSKQYSEVDDIFINDINSRAVPSFYEISNYKSVTFLRNLETLKDLPCKSNEELIVTINNSYDAENILNEVLSICPLLNRYEKIGSHVRAYATSYHLYGQNIEKQKCHIYDYQHDKMLGCKDIVANDENICMTLKDNVISGIFYKETGCWNLWFDNWVLDIRNGALSDGTNVALWDYNGTSAQQWKLEENDDGTVTFVSMDENYVMTRGEDGNVYLGARKEGDISQKWYMESIDTNE